MELQKGSSGGAVGLFALGLAVLAACMNDPERGGDGKVRGYAKYECGPAGGLFLSLNMDREAAPACTSSTLGEFRLWLDFHEGDSLKAGTTWVDTLKTCINYKCDPKSVLRFEVERADSVSLKGFLDVQYIGGSGGKSSYQAELMRCKYTPEICI